MIEISYRKLIDFLELFKLVEPENHEEVKNWYRISAHNNGFPFFDHYVKFSISYDTVESIFFAVENKKEKLLTVSDEMWSNIFSIQDKDDRVRYIECMKYRIYNTYCNYYGTWELFLKSRVVVQNNGSDNEKRATETYERCFEVLADLMCDLLEEFEYLASTFDNPLFFEDGEIPRCKIVSDDYMYEILWRIQDNEIKNVADFPNIDYCKKIYIKDREVEINISADEELYKQIYKDGLKHQYFRCNHYMILSKIVQNLDFNDDDYFDWIFVKPSNTDARNRANPEQPSLSDLIIFILNLIQEKQSNLERRDNERVCKLIQKRITIQGKPIEFIKNRETQSHDTNIIKIYSKLVSSARGNIDDPLIKKIFFPS